MILETLTSETLNTKPSSDQPGGAAGNASRGAAILVFRQLVSLVIGFGSLILLTRQIGAAAYGVYATAYGIYLFVYSLADFGIETFLITSIDEPNVKTLDSAFVLTMINSIAAAGGAILLIHLLAGWAGLPDLIPVGTVMLLAIPVHLSVVVPLSRLLRGLAFKKIAAIELGNQLIFQSVTLALAFNGFSFWAPVCGWWIAIVWTTAAFFWVERRWVPRLLWCGADAKSMLKFGAGYSVSIWAWQARGFVIPMLIGRFLGAEAVGLVALLVRLVEALTFIRIPLNRIATSYLPKVVNDKSEVTLTIIRSIQGVIVILVPLSLLFSLIGRQLLLLVYGTSWAGIMDLFPFVFAGYLVYCLSTFQVSLLLVFKRKWTVAGFQLCHLMVSAIALVLLLPKFGMLGYGLAELATIPVYTIIVRGTLPLLDSSRMLEPAVWVFASLLAVLAPVINLVFVLPLFALLIQPKNLRLGVEFTHSIGRFLHFKSNLKEERF